MDNSQYILKTPAEVNAFCQKLKEPTKYANLKGLTLNEYLEKVCAELNKLPEGKSLVIENVVSSENIETFIQCACIYVLECKAAVEFSNDYKSLKRI